MGRNNFFRKAGKRIERLGRGGRDLVIELAEGAINVSKGAGNLAVGAVTFNGGKIRRGAGQMVDGATGAYVSAGTLGKKLVRESFRVACGRKVANYAEQVISVPIALGEVAGNIIANLARGDGAPNVTNVDVDLSRLHVVSSFAEDGVVTVSIAGAPLCQELSRFQGHFGDVAICQSSSCVLGDGSFTIFAKGQVCMMGSLRADFATTIKVHLRVDGGVHVTEVHIGEMTPHPGDMCKTQLQKLLQDKLNANFGGVDNLGDLLCRPEFVHRIQLMAEERGFDVREDVISRVLRQTAASIQGHVSPAGLTFHLNVWEVLGRVANLAGGDSGEFSVYCNMTMYGDRLYLVGTFCDWNPHAGIALNGDAFPTWTCQIPILPPGRYEYKVVKFLRNSEEPIWEGGENRSFAI